MAETELCRAGLHEMAPENLTNNGRCKACKRISDRRSEDARKRERRDLGPFNSHADVAELSEAAKERKRKSLIANYQVFVANGSKAPTLSSSQPQKTEEQRRAEHEAFLDTKPEGSELTWRELNAVDVVTA